MRGQRRSFRGTRRQRGPGATLALVLALTLALNVVLSSALWVTPVIAQEASEPPTRDQIDRNQEQVRDAQVTLEELERRVERAELQLIDIERTLMRKQSELTLLDEDLQAARAEEAEASARTLVVSVELDRALTAMDAATTELDQARVSLHRRVAAAYKHGTPNEVALASTVGAGSLHDLLIVSRTTQRLVVDGRNDVHRTQASVLTDNDARRAVADRRGESLAIQRVFQRARRSVEVLVRQQTATVQAVEQQYAQRSAILREFEADRLGQVALVRQLKARTVELSARYAAEIGEAWRDVIFDGPMPEWAAYLPTQGRQWAPAISGAAVRNGLDPRLLAALIWAESNFNPAAVSRVGAVGMCQLMPATAAGMGVDPWNPIENLDGGARYLFAQLNRFGTIDLALAAYNAGPGAVSRYGGVPPYAETQFYVLRVLGYYERILGL